MIKHTIIIHDVLCMSLLLLSDKGPKGKKVSKKERSCTHALCKNAMKKHRLENSFTNAYGLP